MNINRLNLKKMYFVVLILLFSTVSCNTATDKTNSDSAVIKNDNKIEHLTNSDFKTKVFNYENSKEWKYEGDLPCIVDFYASWCGPCKMIAPTLEELSKEFDGKIKIYKIDVDEEKELARSFGIESIPTLWFCTAKGKPYIQMGALSKETFVELINSKLLNNIK